VDPEDIKSLWNIWNFSKEQGLHWVDNRYGAQRARFIRPKCIGYVRARTQKLINKSIYSAGLFSTSVVNLSLKNLEV
jgi:hypothetical protein